MSYEKLEIWVLARDLTVKVHHMTLARLPKFEMYEEGAQIRRSMKSVRSNIVEGYGRRRFKQDYLRFLTYALASCDETRDHLNTLRETGSLSDEGLYASLHDELLILGRKLNLFIQAVEAHHRSVREAESDYPAPRPLNTESPTDASGVQSFDSAPNLRHPGLSSQDPGPSIQHPASRNDLGQ